MPKKYKKCFMLTRNDWEDWHYVARDRFLDHITEKYSIDGEGIDFETYGTFNSKGVEICVELESKDALSSSQAEYYAEEAIKQTIRYNVNPQTAYGWEIKSRR